MQAIPWKLASRRRSEQAGLDRVAHEEDAAEPERQSTDPDGPAAADLLFQRGAGSNRFVLDRRRRLFRAFDVVDRIRIMTYDYSWDAPGPISPHPWARAVAEHAAATLRPGTVQIGAPTYGYDWARLDSSDRDGDGDISWLNVEFTGLTANQAVSHVSYWSALTGGTFYGSAALTGDISANAAGAYTVTSVVETSSAS